MTFASKEMLGDEFVFNSGVFKPDEEFKFEQVVPGVGEIQTVELSLDDKDGKLFYL